MKLEKRIISLLVGISLLTIGIFTSCDNPSGPSNGTEDVKKTEEKGIKLTWGDLPANVKHLSIETMIGSRSYNLFEVNDLSKYKYVIDKNVTKGQSYKYRFNYLDDNFNWIDSTEWQTYTAEDGNGEQILTAVATDKGIKLSALIPENVYSSTLEKFENGYISRFLFNDKSLDSDGSFTDKLVDKGTEYEYRLVLTVGSPRHWENDIEIPADPLVEYPRLKPVKIIATGGDGNIKTTTLPKAEYNSGKKTISITQSPTFSVTPKSWRMYLNYSKSNSGITTFVSFNSNNNDQKEKPINENVSDGLWNFAECWFNLIYDNFTYAYGEYEVSDVPQTIPLNINSENLFIPTVTAKENGIEISWDKSKLPVKTKRIEIRSGNNYYDIYDISITPINSILDKYVESGKNYEYYIVAKDQNGNTLKQSEIVRVKANGGIGPLKITNKISITYDDKKDSVLFSELPKLADNSTDWYMNFHYKNSNNEYKKIFEINPENKLSYSLYNVQNGDWIFACYWINYKCDSSYRYCQYEESIDAFSSIPTTIKLSDAYRPVLTATQLNQGVKFEWKNIPENASNLYISLNKKDGDSFTDLNIYSTNVTSIIDKYLDANSEYICYVGWKNNDGSWGYSRDISVIPSKGLGEVKITNKPVATFDSENKSVTFTTPPEISGFTEWECSFGYWSEQMKKHEWPCHVWLDDNKITEDFDFDEVAAGNWTLDNYCVWIECDDFEYEHYEYDDISNLSDIPQSFNL